MLKYGHPSYGFWLITQLFLSNLNLVVCYVYVIWHNWAKKGLNMGVAVPQAPVGSWGLGPPQKFSHGS